MTHRFLAPLALWACSTCLFAAAPTLSNVQPRGGQRGTDVEVTFNGNRLGDTQEVLYYSPGFSTVKLEPAKDNQVKATIKLAPDCRLGEHAVRLRTATGLSEMRTFWVGALPTVEEKEPNSDFASPQPIALNVTVHGVVQNEDVDYFVVEAKKGQRINVEVEGLRLGLTLFDPYVAILDEKRFELARSDDTPLLAQDPTTGIVAPADGKYIIQIRETSYGGNGACAYRLHVGTFPRPVAMIPAGGKPGEELDVTLLGDPAGPITQRVKLPADPAHWPGLFVQDAGGVSPSPLRFRCVDLPNTIATQATPAPPQAPSGTAPGAFNGIIGANGETDYFRFAAKKGQVFDVRCLARQLGSPLDPVLTLNILGGGQIAANDDSGGPDSYFRFTAPDDKEYVIGVRDHLNKGGPNYFYRVEVTPVVAALEVSIPKVAQYSQERQVVAVPRGNRYAVLLNVSRQNVGGEMVFAPERLPGKVTTACETLAANLTQVPVVFEAAADAPLGASLALPNFKPTDAKVTVPSRFTTQAEHVIGPGQTIFWMNRVPQLAVAVTEAVPYKINVVEPKAPIVQNGSLLLKIVVERQAGFKGPVTVQPLFNPPGLNSATSITIGPDQNEGYLPMNAAGNAPLKKYQTAVIAQAPVGNGPVWVASQLFTLEVAAPFVQFAMERSAVEQGQPTSMMCKVQVNTPFAGPAKVKILGLPNKVTGPDLEITKDSKELLIPLQTDPASPAGNHKNIFCQIVVLHNGEPVVHNVGGTELRIDKPLPKPTAPAPMTTAAKPNTPAPATPAPMQPAKRLTRLEQLRLEQEEREKAQKAGTPAKP
jgi:hypothetical protein